jgi:hypothetical protein
MQMFIHDIDSYLSIVQRISEGAEYADTYTSADRKNIAKNLDHILFVRDRIGLDAKLYNQISDLERPIVWNLIAEPICEESAMVLPYLMAMAESSDSIDLRICLHPLERDAVKEIQQDSYPCFPWLIFEDGQGKMLGQWGPRSAEADQKLKELRAKESDRQRVMNTYREWFSEAGHEHLQAEFVHLFKQWQT